MRQVLIFDVADRRLGLPAATLLEVVRAVAIAPLPKAPPIVEGVINYRGTVVPVLNLRQRFGLPAAPLLPEQHFLIARTGGRLVALRVDRALDLVPVAEADVASPADVAPGADYVSGIARRADGLLVIHDLDAVLSLDEIHGIDAALGETP